MSDFNLDVYLANAMKGVVPEATPLALPDAFYSPKETAIQSASESKKLQLILQTAAKERQLDEQNAGSLVSRLGLDSDSGIGVAADLAAHALAGTARTAAYGLTAAPRAYTALSEATGAMSPEYANRVREGINSFNDWFTETPESLKDTRNVQALNEELNSDANASAALKRVANTDFKGINTSTVQDVATLAANALKSGTNNPAAVLSLLAENSPQIALAITTAGGSAVANAGYALEAYDGWSTGFEAKNGRAPTAQEKSEAIAKASGLFAAELIGDTAMGGLAKAAKGVPKPSIDVSQVFKNKILNTGATAASKVAGVAARPVVAFAEGAVPEVVTEGIQTKLEGDLAFKPATPEEIYFGATAGGLIGGAVSGGAQLVGETAKGVDDIQKVEFKEALNKAKAGVTEAVGKVVNNNPLYNKAIEIAKEADAETATPESVNATAEKLYNEAYIPAVTALQAAKLQTTEGRTEIYSAKIDEAKAELATATPEEVAKIEGQIAEYETQLAKPVDPQEEKNALNKIKKLQNNVEGITSLVKATLDKQQQFAKPEELVAEANELVKPVQATTEAVEGSQTVTNTQATPESKQAAERFLVRAMTVRNVTPEVADAMLKVADSGLLNEEKSSVLRGLATVETVSKDIATGTERRAYKQGAYVPGKDFESLPGKLTRAATEFEAGRIDNGLGLYQRAVEFREDRVAKAEAIKKLDVGEAAVLRDGKYQTVSIDDINTATDRVAYRVDNNRSLSEGIPKTIAGINRDIAVTDDVVNAFEAKYASFIPTKLTRTNVKQTPQEVTPTPKTDSTKANQDKREEDKTPSELVALTAAVLEERDNVQQNTPAVVQRTQETKPTTTQDTSNTGSVQTNQEQKAGSLTEDSRPSSEVVGTESVRESSKPSLITELKLLLDTKGKLSKLGEYKAVLEQLLTACQ